MSRAAVEAGRVSDTAIARLVARVPAYVATRIRRPPPDRCHVLPGSTPVVAFGDPSRSAVATLGLNPSRIEFEVDGIELDGPLRRFETLAALDLARLEDAPAEAVERVWERCVGYFQGNPYRRWFDRLEPVLSPLGASYYGGSACHLDLSQWATDATWNELPAPAHATLIEDGAEFLLAQLRSEPIRLLLLNGRGVITAFQTALRGQLRREREPVTDRTVMTQLYTGRIGEVHVIGWSTNLQSSFGVTRQLRERLAERVATLAARPAAL